MTEFSGTYHNSARKDEIAKTVLMPGDPDRARYIAEKYLTNVREVSRVRGILAFTGEYRGKKLTVMASGMGTPSIGIYSYELYRFYDVENIIRTGSAGVVNKDKKTSDVALVTYAISESTYARSAFGFAEQRMDGSEKIIEALRSASASLNKPLWEGCADSEDVFYYDPKIEAQRTIPEDCVGLEMESFGLYANARYFGKNAATLVTVFEEDEAADGQKVFDGMIEVALEAAILL